MYFVVLLPEYIDNGKNGYETIQQVWSKRGGTWQNVLASYSKGHPRSLKSSNEQKIFVDKLPFLSRFAQHT